jgi:Flp pilus assembly pilin Flp
LNQVLRSLWADEEGSTAIEMALAFAVLTVGSLAGVVGLIERATLTSTHQGMAVLAMTDATAAVPH